MADLKSVKITGQTINSIKNAFVSESLAAKFIVEAVGEDIDPEKYYPAEGFLKALKNIGSTMNPAVLRNVGTKIIESAQWPQGLDSLTSGLASISVAYKMNHEPNNPTIIGDYIYAKIGEGEYTITCTNPYPCEFDEGIINGVARTFEKNVFVKHMDGPCRKKGDDRCIYLIRKII